MAEIAIDANVIVGHLYTADAQHGPAEELLDRLEAQGHEVVLLDVLVQEAVSVLCRRAAERKTDPPNLDTTLEVVRGWYDSGEVRFVAREAERLVSDVLDVILETAGVLNFNDRLVVVLQRQGEIDGFAAPAWWPSWTPYQMPRHRRRRWRRPRTSTHTVPRRSQRE